MVERLEAGEILCHAMVIAELACGHLSPRKTVLALLNSLPRGRILSQEEFMSFVENRSLAGKGLGYVDAHLLGSALLEEAAIWTFDGSLRREARKAGLASP